MSLAHPSSGTERATVAKPWLNMARRDALWGYVFIAPSMLFFLIFSIYPMIDSIILSFQHFDLRTRTWIGLDNYHALVTSPVFYTVLRNTVLYALAIAPVGVVVSLVLATMILRLPTAAQIFFKSAYYLPVVTSGVVLSLIWLYLYDSAFGLLNYILGTVGISPLLWLADPKLSKLSIVLMYHTSSWGASIILLTASMGSIPDHYYEAARIEGASAARQFVSITLPLVKPAMAYVTIIGTIASLQIFTEVFLMTRGGPNYTTTNLVYYIYDVGFIRFNFGMASAVAVILLLITMVVAVLQFRVFSTDVEY